ncbi:hypothetical protein PI125_g26202 [Phytophthora idaei]|nr:hypothetical protein PI125_g26202 [Phytophthora idaei]
MGRGVPRGFHPLTRFTCLHVPGYPLVHVGPPDGLRDRQEGLLATPVAAGGRIVRLLEDIKLQILVVGNNDPRRLMGLHPVVEEVILPLVSVEPGPLSWREPFRLGPLPAVRNRTRDASDSSFRYAMRIRS